MKKKGWMTEERLKNLLVSLRWYASRWGDRSGSTTAAIVNTGFAGNGALAAIASGRIVTSWSADVRTALEALVSLGLVEKQLLGSMIPGRTFKLYRWVLTPAGFAAKGVGSSLMTKEQLAGIAQAADFHRDDQKRRAAKIKMIGRERTAEACAS
jgi:hypothetical protein